MLDLDKIRMEIDQVDRELVSLLEKRMDLVGQVLSFKKSTGKAVLDNKRETEVLDKVGKRVQNKQYEKTIQATFQVIMDHSKVYQSQELEKSHEREN